MEEVARLLNELLAAGVITNYALFGATAQMRYTEPVATLDVDVLVSLPAPEKLDLLKEIYAFCAAKGHRPEGESIRVGPWPVQFVPTFDSITEEAIAKADTVDFEGVPLRVVDADHLAVIALNTGRAKDFARILALLDSSSATADSIAKVASQHGLHDKWLRFQSRFLNA